MMSYVRYYSCCSWISVMVVMKLFVSLDSVIGCMFLNSVMSIDGCSVVVMWWLLEGGVVRMEFRREVLIVMVVDFDMMLGWLVMFVWYVVDVWLSWMCMILL